MSPEDKLPDAIAAVHELNESVVDLADVVKKDRESSKTRDMWLAVSVALDVILSFVIVFGGYLIDRSQDEISAIQEAQKAETELNRSNQCALTNMLLRFENTSTTSPTVAPEEKQRRIEAYADLHKIHADLKCESQ